MSPSKAPASSSRLAVSIAFAGGRVNVTIATGPSLHVDESTANVATHAPDELARNERELLELLAYQRTLPHIGATFALDDTARALRYVADGNAIGTVVVDVSS